MTNSAYPDQLASSDSKWSGSTLFASGAYMGSAGQRWKDRIYSPHAGEQILQSLWRPQERVALMLKVKTGPKSNLSEILCLSLLSANLIQIWSKMKLLLSWQYFPHYMSMGILVAVETKVLTRPTLKPNTANPPHLWLYLWNLIKIVWKCGGTDGCTDSWMDDSALLYNKLTLWAS